MRHYLTTLSVLIVLAANVYAQRTWIVDRFNGPGTDFLDIPPAVAAARSGDTLIVRRGGYNGTRTSKGLRIVASFAGGIGSVLLTPLEVTGLPVGETFVLRGFASSYSLNLSSNAGTIHVEDMDEGSTIIDRVGTVTDCALVTLSNCRLLNGIDCRRSSIAISNSVIRGLGDFGSPALSTPGICAANSRLYIGSTSIRGHDSQIICGTCPQSTTASPGMIVINSTVQLDRHSAVSGGIPLPNQPGGPVGQSAIVATATALTLDPNVAISGSLGALPIQSDRPPIFEVVPGLAVTGEPPSGVATVSVTAPPGTLALLAMSPPAPSAPLGTSFGELVLDPRAIAIVSVGSVSNDGRWTTLIPIPNQASLAGAPIMFQGLASIPHLALTLPAGIVLW
jgi:hypothetical protein